MGAMTFSIDVTMVELLRQALPLSVFVETGTFEGDTVALVLSQFEEIHTIELSHEYYARALERFRSNGSVTVYHDDSPRALASLRSRLEHESVLYWLDAHWCVAKGTASAHSQCPLLSELEAIGTLNSESVIMIDDARLFLCTPPQPHETENWPRFHEVIQGLYSLSTSHEAMVINDVIVLFPAAIAGDVSKYARANSIDWFSSLRRLEVVTQALADRMADINELRLEQEMLYRTAAERLTTIEELSKALKGERSRRRS